MSLNPLDTDQKSVEPAIGAKYILEKVYDKLGRTGSELRAWARQGWKEDSYIDLGKPDEVLESDPRVKIQDFAQDNSSKSGKTNQKNGGGNMTDYDGPNFWEDVKTGMEGLDEDLTDLADYIENGNFENAVDTMVAAANQVGGYDQARQTAESVAEYLEQVQNDVEDISDDLEAHEQDLNQAAQDIQDIGFNQDEQTSMDDIQGYVNDR